MPDLKNHAVFAALRRMRTFLNPGTSTTGNVGSDRQEQLFQGAAGAARSSGLSTSREEPPDRHPAPHRSASPRPASLASENTSYPDNNIQPENIIWMFGTARTGSTWLSAMMGELAEGNWWREPLVGQLFDSFYDSTIAPHFERPHFILSNATRDSWLEGIRGFVLNAIQAHFSGEDNYLVVAEPNGSIGAPLIMEALPESKMVFLVRDPRDVAASALDRNRKGSDAYKTRAQDPRKAKTLANNPADHNPDGFIKTQAQRYVRNVSRARQAFENHRGPKVMIKYEDLRSETLQTMKRLYAELGISVDEEELARVVGKHSWENIPKEKKGPGKSNRKATPGGWREDLTPEQVEIVERVTVPLLKEFYPN